MPHKRKTRLHVNQRNCTARRVQLAPSAPPTVHVESCNGPGAEIPAPACPKAKVCDLKTSRKPFAADKLAVPQYNTTVRKQNEVRIISSVMLDKKFSPEGVASIAPKVTQKMNFPLDQAVFQDLVNLNVNDSILVPKKTRSTASKNKTSKDTEPNKVKSEPQLADYAEKVEPLEMAIPEPELHLDFTQEPFDFLGAYKKIYH
ncbi:protein PPP1R35 homolog [Drosophila biarmipes]|uniref:protein PPP1R35 homolog n=1 Tax=Drosophila biarmipes TaxID=125945 RepID=UPI0007E75EC5|nr:protein PPP1R35 homolog [Drosophila biarmipes]